MKMVIVTTIGLLISAELLGEPQSHEDQFVFHYESYLKPLREPDIQASCSEQIETVRLIANPAFSNAWSVRIERKADLISVFFSEANLSGEPALSNQTVDESVWLDLEKIRDSAKIRDLPKTTDVWIPDDTIATIETCVGGEYFLVQRQFWHPETKDVVEHITSLRPPE